MKRHRLILSSAVVLVLFVFFVGQYVSGIMAEERARQTLLNHVYGHLIIASSGLNGLIDNMESEGAQADVLELAAVSNNFIRLDAMLKQYGMHFPAHGLQYGGFFGFDFIAHTLVGRGGWVNDLRYDSIAGGGVSRENQILYLAALRDDINLMVAQMTCDENHLQENRDLSISALNMILNDFLHRWSLFYENSPLWLLES